MLLLRHSCRGSVSFFSKTDAFREIGLRAFMLDAVRRHDHRKLVPDRLGLVPVLLERNMILRNLNRRFHPPNKKKSANSHQTISPKSPRNIPETSPKRPRNVPETSPKHPRNIPEASSKHPRNIPEISPKHPRNIPDISPKHPRNIPGTSPKYP